MKKLMPAFFGLFFMFTVISVLAHSHHGHDHSHEHSKEHEHAHDHSHGHSHCHGHSHGHSHDGEAWIGVDHVVIEEFAAQAGRPPRGMFINLMQGELPMLIFILSGSIAGFVAGYQYRKLFASKD